jgi:hypothetical protein
MLNTASKSVQKLSHQTGNPLVQNRLNKFILSTNWDGFEAQMNGGSISRRYATCTNDIKVAASKVIPSRPRCSLLRWELTSNRQSCICTPPYNGAARPAHARSLTLHGAGCPQRLFALVMGPWRPGPDSIRIRKKGGGG